MRILIETIPHEQQRYPTPGDWQFLFVPTCHGCGNTRDAQENCVGPGDCGDCGAKMEFVELIRIRVSELSDWRCEALVAVHELVELLLCRQRGITPEEVDAFDKEFEAKRQPGNEDEPGDDPAAPYRKEHFFATNIEALLSSELGVDFQDYGKEIVKLQ